METFSFKISTTEDEALNSLANRWKCNRAEAARRALNLANRKTESADFSDITKAHLQEIVSLQKESIHLLKELAKFTPIVTKINHLEEFTVQACLSAGVLAKQAGLFDAARDEYLSWKQNKENTK